MSNTLTENNTIIPIGLPRVSIDCSDQICSTLPPSSTSSMPESFDLRVKYPGLIGGALSQGTCSACWAYSTSTAFGDRIRIFSRNGTSVRTFYEDISDGRFIVGWNETNIKTDGRTLLRNQVVIPYRLYDTINVNGRQIVGIVDKSVLNTLSPTYLAACDVCELPFDLNSKVGQYLRSKGVQCSSCCAGGLLMYAHIFLVLNGVISIQCDPLPSQYVCSGWTGCIPYRAKSVYKISLSNYSTTSKRVGNTIFNTQTQIPISPEQYQTNMNRIMRNIMDYGTVSASMQTYENFKTGSSGYISIGDGLMLYFQTAGRNSGGHAICIIGWDHIDLKMSDGSTRRTLYWICRNSWGVNWLKSIKPKVNPDGSLLKDLNPGFFAVLRGSNFCGIEEDCMGSTPFSVYDILGSNGDEKLIPPSMRPLRQALESLPCSMRPIEPQGKDDVFFTDSCSKCRKGAQMCLKTEENGDISVCSINPY